MGARAQVLILQEDTNSGVYLYTHWGAETLLKDVAIGLEQSKTRWDDPEYLAHIVLDNLKTRDRINGCGIGTVQHLDIEKLITIYHVDKRVWLETTYPADEEEKEGMEFTQQWTFEEFIKTYS